MRLVIAMLAPLLLFSGRECLATSMPETGRIATISAHFLNVE
jgi:hypothetical protein